MSKKTKSTKKGAFSHLEGINVITKYAVPTTPGQIFQAKHRKELRNASVVSTSSANSSRNTNPEEIIVISDNSDDEEKDSDTPITRGQKERQDKSSKVPALKHSKKTANPRSNAKQQPEEQTRTGVAPRGRNKAPNLDPTIKISDSQPKGDPKTPASPQHKHKNHPKSSRRKNEKILHSEKTVHSRYKMSLAESSGSRNEAYSVPPWRHSSSTNALGSKTKPIAQSTPKTKFSGPVTSTPSKTFGRHFSNPTSSSSNPQKIMDNYKKMMNTQKSTTPQKLGGVKSSQKLFESTPNKDKAGMSFPRLADSQNVVEKNERHETYKRLRDLSGRRQLHSEKSQSPAKNINRAESKNVGNQRVENWLLEVNKNPNSQARGRKNLTKQYEKERVKTLEDRTTGKTKNIPQSSSQTVGASDIIRKESEVLSQSDSCEDTSPDLQEKRKISETSVTEKLTREESLKSTASKSSKGSGKPSIYDRAIDTFINQLNSESRKTTKVFADVSNNSASKTTRDLSEMIKKRGSSKSKSSTSNSIPSSPTLTSKRRKNNSTSSGTSSFTGVYKLSQESSLDRSSQQSSSKRQNSDSENDPNGGKKTSNENDRATSVKASMSQDSERKFSDKDTSTVWDSSQDSVIMTTQDSNTSQLKKLERSQGSQSSVITSSSKSTIQEISPVLLSSRARMLFLQSTVKKPAILYSTTMSSQSTSASNLMSTQSTSSSNLSPVLSSSSQVGTGIFSPSQSLVKKRPRAADFQNLQSPAKKRPRVENFQEKLEAKRSKFLQEVEQDEKKINTVLDSVLSEAKKKSKEKRLGSLGSPVSKRSLFASPMSSPSRGMFQKSPEHPLRKMLKSYSESRRSPSKTSENEDVIQRRTKTTETVLKSTRNVAELIITDMSPNEKSSPKKSEIAPKASIDQVQVISATPVLPSKIEGNLPVDGKKEKPPSRGALKVSGVDVLSPTTTATNWSLVTEAEMRDSRHFKDLESMVSEIESDAESVTSRTRSKLKKAKTKNKPKVDQLSNPASMLVTSQSALKVRKDRLQQSDSVKSQTRSKVKGVEKNKETPPKVDELSNSASMLVTSQSALKVLKDRPQQSCSVKSQTRSKVKCPEKNKETSTVNLFGTQRAHRYKVVKGPPSDLTSDQPAQWSEVTKKIEVNEPSEPKEKPAAYLPDAQGSKVTETASKDKETPSIDSPNDQLTQGSKVAEKLKSKRPTRGPKVTEVASKDKETPSIDSPNDQLTQGSKVTEVAPKAKGTSSINLSNDHPAQGSKVVKTPQITDSTKTKEMPSIDLTNDESPGRSNIAKPSKVRVFFNPEGKIWVDPTDEDDSKSSHDLLCDTNSENSETNVIDLTVSDEEEDDDDVVEIVSVSSPDEDAVRLCETAQTGRNMTQEGRKHSKNQDDTLTTTISLSDKEGVILQTDARATNTGKEPEITRKSFLEAAQAERKTTRKIRKDGKNRDDTLSTMISLSDKEGVKLRTDARATNTEKDQEITQKSVKAGKKQPARATNTEKEPEIIRKSLKAGKNEPETLSKNVRAPNKNPVKPRDDAQVLKGHAKSNTTHKRPKPDKAQTLNSTILVSNENPVKVIADPSTPKLRKEQETAGGTETPQQQKYSESQINSPSSPAHISETEASSLYNISATKADGKHKTTQAWSIAGESQVQKTKKDTKTPDSAVQAPLESVQEVGDVRYERGESATKADGKHKTTQVGSITCESQVQKAKKDPKTPDSAVQAPLESVQKIGDVRSEHGESATKAKHKTTQAGSIAGESQVQKAKKDTKTPDSAVQAPLESVQKIGDMQYQHEGSESKALDITSDGDVPKTTSKDETELQQVAADTSELSSEELDAPALDKSQNQTVSSPKVPSSDTASDGATGTDKTHESDSLEASTSDSTSVATLPDQEISNSGTGTTVDQSLGATIPQTDGYSPETNKDVQGSSPHRKQDTTTGGHHSDETTVNEENQLKPIKEVQTENKHSRDFEKTVAQIPAPPSGEKVSNDKELVQNVPDSSVTAPMELGVASSADSNTASEIPGDVSKPVQTPETAAGVGAAETNATFGNDGRTAAMDKDATDHDSAASKSIQCPEVVAGLGANVASNDDGTTTDCWSNAMDEDATDRGSKTAFEATKDDSKAIQSPDTISGISKVPSNGAETADNVPIPIGINQETAASDPSAMDEDATDRMDDFGVLDEDYSPLETRRPPNNIFEAMQYDFFTPESNQNSVTVVNDIGLDHDSQSTMPDSETLTCLPDSNDPEPNMNDLVTEDSDKPCKVEKRSSNSTDASEQELEKQSSKSTENDQTDLQGLKTTQSDEEPLQSSKSSTDNSTETQDPKSVQSDSEPPQGLKSTENDKIQSSNSNDEKDLDNKMFDISQFFDDNEDDLPDELSDTELELNDYLPEMLCGDAISALRQNENDNTGDTEDDINEDLLDELPDLTQTPRSKRRKFTSQSDGHKTTLAQSERMMSRLLERTFTTQHSSAKESIAETEWMKELDEIVSIDPDRPRNSRKRLRSMEQSSTLKTQPSFNAILADTAFSRSYKVHGASLKKLVREKKRDNEVDKMEKILLSDLKKGGFRRTLEQAEHGQESNIECDEETKRAINLMKKDWGTLPILSPSGKIFSSKRLQYCQHKMKLESCFDSQTLETLTPRIKTVIFRLSASYISQQSGDLNFLLNQHTTRVQTYKWLLDVLHCHEKCDTVQRIIQSNLRLRKFDQSPFSFSQFKSTLIKTGVSSNLFDKDVAAERREQQIQEYSICGDCIRKRHKTSARHMVSIAKVLSTACHVYLESLTESEQVENTVFLLLLLQERNLRRTDVMEIIRISFEEINDWESLKFSIVHRLIELCTSLNVLQSIAVRLRCNDERPHELSRILSFGLLKLHVFGENFNIDNFNDLEALVDIVDHFNPENLELLLVPEESEEKIGSQKRSYYHLSLLLPLLNICIGDKCEDNTTLAILDRIWAILRTMNKRIRDNGAIYRSQVKYELALFIKHLRILIQKGPKQNTASIFKYLRSAPVKEEVVDASINQTDSSSESSDEVGVLYNDDNEEVKGHQPRSPRFLDVDDEFRIARVIKSRIIGHAGKD